MALARPTSPDATSISATDITVSWTNGASYDTVHLEYNATGIWHAESRFIFAGSVTSESVPVTSNVLWSFRIRGYTSADGFSAYSDIVSATCHTGSVSGTVNVSGSISQAVDFTGEVTATLNVYSSISQKVDFHQTITGTVNLSATTLGGGSKTLKTDYKYFLGTADGTIHEHSEEYKGDAGVIIPCQYVTKDTDFTSQDQQSNDQWKTVYAVKVFYEDMSADTDIVVAISTDGGYTYIVSQSQTLGNGDKTRKDATFYFIITGQFFRFKMSSGSASTTFKFLGMEVEYEDAGQHWVVA